MSYRDQFNKHLVAFLLVIALMASAYFIFTANQRASTGNTLPVKTDLSIAVLPFINLSNDPEQEFFSDGLTEGILNSLAKLQGLKVTARTSSFKFKGQAVNVQEAGKKLGVRTLLEGSMERYNDRVRVKAELINVEDKFQFWSEQYEEAAGNISNLQDRIVTAVAEQLQLNAQLNARPVLISNHGPRKEEYELYLKGRSLWNLRTPPNLLKAIEHFEQAIASDPLYAQAYAGIADCYTALGYGSHLAPHVAFPKAIEAAKKALELDSTLAEPHASLGYCRFYYNWDWAEAEQEFRVALALNPNYETAYDGYGYYLTAMQRYDEAIDIFKKAATLDPLSAVIQTDIGFSFYYSGNYDMALQELQTSIQMNPKNHLSRIWLGRTYQAKKMYPEAIDQYSLALEIAPEWPVALAQIGNVYGVAGKKIEAQEILSLLKSLASKKYVTSYGIALLFAGLNEDDQAFSALNKAYEERSHWLVWLKTDPRWSLLRSDKRYAALINSVGLPD